MTGKSNSGKTGQKIQRRSFLKGAVAGGAAAASGFPAPGPLK